MLIDIQIFFIYYHIPSFRQFALSVSCFIITIFIIITTFIITIIIIILSLLLPTQHIIIYTTYN